MRIASQLRYAFTLALVLAQNSCCGSPWGLSTAPTKAQPDEQYRTGTVHGYSVYVWHCYQGQRVVVAQYSAEMSCRGPEVERTACGGTTALEKRADEVGSRYPQFESSLWPKTR